MGKITRQELSSGLINELVTSVAGKTGEVTLAAADVGLGNVTNDAQLPIAGGAMTGILETFNNTSYTVKQSRNIILSTADANISLMENGDIWIKYA